MIELHLPDGTPFLVDDHAQYVGPAPLAGLLAPAVKVIALALADRSAHTIYDERSGCWITPRMAAAKIREVWRRRS